MTAITSPQTVAWQGDHLMLDDQPFGPTRILGEGKSAVSWLYTALEGPGQITVKRYQTKDYNQIPHAEALDFELESWKRMAGSGIAVPRLRGFDREAYVLVKDFVPGTVLIDDVAQGTVEEDAFRQLFQMAGQLRKAGWHVDFYPANFVMSGGRLWCIDYEAHPYNAEWGLEEWGIWYWVNAEGIRTTLANPDAGVLNYPGTFKPRREGLEVARNRLVEAYGALA